MRRQFVLVIDGDPWGPFSDPQVVKKYFESRGAIVDASGVYLYITFLVEGKYRTVMAEITPYYANPTPIEDFQMERIETVQI